MNTPFRLVFSAVLTMLFAGAASAQAAGAFGAATGIPTLSEVTSVPYQGRTMSVDFTLPEAALAGSVKLTFDDGSNVTQFTLSSVFETAGQHNLSFDPDNPFASGDFTDGAPLADGSYSVTLSYQDALGHPPATSAAVDGVVVASTPAPGTVEPLDASLLGEIVYGMAAQPDGKIIIAGDFTSVLGVPRNYIARLNVNGTLDMDFNPNPNDRVLCVAVQPDGKILLGGIFVMLQPNGAPDSTSRLFLARLNADGTLDTGYNPGANSPVTCIVPQGDGKVLVCGTFDAFQTNGMGEFIPRPYIARLNADGSVDPGFDPHPNASVNSMAVQTDGKVVLGGFFDTLQPNGVGATVTRNRAARVLADGTVDPNFDPNPSDTVVCVAVQPNGQVLLGGPFSSVQPPGAPSPITRKSLARFNENGTLDMGFDPAPNSDLRSIAVQANGDVLLAGDFTALQPNNAPSPILRNYIARVHGDGTLDTDFDPNADSNVFSIALEADGRILIGGFFDTLQPNGAPFPTTRNHFARLANQAGFDQLTVPDATKVLWTREQSVPDVLPVIFERSIDDGASWTLLGTGTRVGGTANWQRTGLSLGGLRGKVRAGGQINGGFGNGSAGHIERIVDFDFDTFTVVPTLAAPIGLTKSPVSVDFTLPEAAKAGTVKLSFLGAVTRVLTLAASQETAGQHTFSFNPANPTASAQIASGSPIPDGNYAVTVSYQDALNHPEATSNENIQTTIDTHAGSIAGPFSPLTIFPGALPDYTGQVQGDQTEPLYVSGQNPPGGTIVSVGTVTVTITAHDDAGNESTVSFDVRVRPTDPASTVSLVAGTNGDHPPGSGAAGGPPADAKLTSFGIPAIDDLGNIAFTAQWISFSGGKGKGLFTDRCLAKVGDVVIGVTNARFKSFTDPVIDAGRVTCLATFSGVPKPGAAAVLSFAANGALTVVAQSGQSATADGATFKSFKAVAAAGNYVGFLAQLNAKTGTAPKTTAANDMGLWVKEGTDPLVLALREGQQVDGHTIKTLVSFVTGNGSPGQGRGWLVERPAIGAQVLALAMFTDKTQAVIAVDPDDVANPVVLSQTKVADDTGSPDIPGASFASYGIPAANAIGSSAFLASLTVGQGGITKANARGIFADFGGLGSCTTVALLGDDADGTGAKFSAFKDIVLSAEDGLAFPATIKGGSVKGLAATTLWWLPPGEDLTLLAQGGAQPPEVPAGAQWKAFSSLAIAADRGPIFSATLVPGKGGVNAKTASGVWAVDFFEQTRLLFRTGTTDVISGKTLKNFTLLKASSGNTGVSRSFNGTQQVTWLATFTDKTQAIVVTEVP